MTSLFNRLGFQIGAGICLLLCLLTASLVWPLFNQSRATLFDAAEARQAKSLRILVNELSRVQDLDVTMAPNGDVREVVSDGLASFDDHRLIDTVGQISGETATVFLWDAQQRDFVRATTNIRKPDGSRAVGTVLGQRNKVYDAMMAGDVFRGQATILGNEYLTIYIPVTTAAGNPLGILYVGVAKEVINATIGQMLVVALVIAGLGLLVAMGLTLIGLRIMLRPIQSVEAAVDAVRNANYDTVVPHTHRPDAIGSVARSVDAFREQLAVAAKAEERAKRHRERQDEAIARLQHGMERLAQRDLSHRIGDEVDFPPEYEGLRRDFDTVASNLCIAIAEITSVAHNLRSSAGDVEAVSSDLSRRVERQAATLEETAAALEELTMSGEKVSSRVAEANDLAATSTEVSRQSGEQLEEAVGAIRQVEKASAEIDKIVDLIEDIAFQTNLLALNAGVEAARAGEAGKGFAVVANEVRSLAHRASDSVGEIRSLTQANMTQVSEGSRLVETTGTSIHAVLKQINDLGALVAEITQEVQSQSSGLNEINLGMRDLDTATQENAAVAGNADDASTRLLEEAGRLAETVSAFRTETDESQGAKVLMAAE